MITYCNCLLILNSPLCLPCNIHESFSFQKESFLNNLSHHNISRVFSFPPHSFTNCAHTNYCFHLELLLDCMQSDLSHEPLMLDFPCWRWERDNRISLLLLGTTLPIRGDRHPDVGNKTEYILHQWSEKRAEGVPVRLHFLYFPLSFHSPSHLLIALRKMENGIHIWSRWIHYTLEQSWFPLNWGNNETRGHQFFFWENM